MLRINRIRTEIKTINNLYGFDETFKQGLNLIASEDNTCGKSSIIAAIYYCLGFEEIIGGRGEKVLTSVYKSNIEDGVSTFPVLESGIYLEISNGQETVTIYRSAKMENRDSKLITVYFSSLNDVKNPGIYREDMYVHMPNSAINKKGFHNFLENFLHIILPIVPASDDGTRKLYLQLIFSAMFIEQKHGWADILSGMPILGIRESKKRVIEFILKLDTLENEKKKDLLRTLESKIRNQWELIVKEVNLMVNKESCTIKGFPLAPKILDEMDFSKIEILKEEEPLEDYIYSLLEEHEKLVGLKPKIVDNFDELQNELNETDSAISRIENEILNNKKALQSEIMTIERLISNLEIINIDITNNKDSARLRTLGSELKLHTSQDRCPVCHQEIQDSLLPNNSEYSVMSIDENIRHLEAQRDMLEFAKMSHEKNKGILLERIAQLENNLLKLRNLGRTLRSDLYMTDDHLSETIIYKRIQLDAEIKGLNELKSYTSSTIDKLTVLSDEWKKYLADRASLPVDKFSVSDEEKLKLLRDNFINNLRIFGYKSVLNLNAVDISKETYQPVIEGFDMKFDSSASDNIRAIWAFTISLAQTSTAKSGNHPSVMIFDEPAQHSIVTDDMEMFFRQIINMNASNQVFVGITIKDSDTRKTIDELPIGSFHIVRVPNKAFKKL